MKKLLLLLVLTSILSAATAQISFTSTHAPKAGSSVRGRSLVEDSLFNFKIGLSGANRVWNFASFKFDTTSGIDQTNFVSPARTIYANDRRVNGATYASFDISTPEDITFDSIATNNWWTIGGADSAGVTRETPPIRYLNFPWTFNSAFRDSTTTVIIDPMSGDSIRFPTINAAKCDAYGSISTSLGTFNCLRTIRTLKQDLEIFPGFEVHILVTSTEWWTTQHPQPVFSYTRADLDVLGDLDSLFLVGGLVQTRVANEEIAKVELKTYPNPAQNTVNVDFESTDNQKVALTVFSLSGQIMRLDRFDAPQGKQVHALDVSNFPNGIYMVHLAGEKSKSLGVRKIVVQH